MAVLYHAGKLFQSDPGCPGKEYEFSLDTPFCEYPKKVQDILIHGTGGHSVKVYYKGQRGEGVYDVAFPD